MLADIHVEGPLAALEVSVFWHTKGVLIFFPIRAGRFRVIADLGKADPSAHLPDPTLADVQAKVDERGPGRRPHRCSDKSLVHHRLPGAALGLAPPPQVFPVKLIQGGCGVSTRAVRIGRDGLAITEKEDRQNS